MYKENQIRTLWLKNEIFEISSPYLSLP